MNTLVKVLQKRYEEINARAQTYSLIGSDYSTRTRLNAERDGALEMLNAAKEAAEYEEQTITGRRDLMRFLCSGEITQSFQEVFPELSGIGTEPPIFAPAELRHRSATLGTASRRT